MAAKKWSEIKSAMSPEFRARVDTLVQAELASINTAVVQYCDGVPYREAAWMTTLELAKAEPVAFSALPECYQADSCLVFGYNEDGELICKPATGQEYAIGNNSYYFCRESGSWFQE